MGKSKRSAENRASAKPTSEASANPPTKRFKAREIDEKIAVKELASRFERAKRFGAELREQRIVSQSFLDREVSI